MRLRCRKPKICQKFSNLGAKIYFHNEAELQETDKTNV